MKDWNAVNFKNFSFIILFLIVLGVCFGVVRIVGTFDSSSMYTQLMYGDE